eukprot:gene7100-12746_t
MASSIHSAEKRLYEKLGMENPNKPKVYTSTVKEGPTIHKVRVIAHDGSKKIPPPVAAKPIFYKASIQQQKVPEKAKPSSASVGAGNSQAKLGTKSMEDELADLTDLLVKNLDNTSDPDFYETKLTGKEFYCVEDEPYCETCYFDSLEECVTCAKKITERILRAQGFSYHPECFTCSVCSSNLDNVPFTVDATNQVHCVECYQLKFSPRCAACQKLILPENEKGETVHIVSMQKNFHVACYKCEDCGILLSSETGQGCYPLDGHLLCQLCNGKRVQRMTSDLTPEPSTEL